MRCTAVPGTTCKYITEKDAFGCMDDALACSAKHPQLHSNIPPLVKHKNAVNIIASEAHINQHSTTTIQHTPHLYSITPSSPGRLVVSKHAANASGVRTSRRPVPLCLLFLSIHSPGSSVGCVVTHSVSEINSHFRCVCVVFLYGCNLFCAGNNDIGM